MKNKMSQHDCTSKSEKEYVLTPKLGFLHVVLCVCSAVILCSCIALCEVGWLQWQTRSRQNNSERDPIRIYIDQGHNPLPHHNNGAEGNGLYEQDLTFDIGHLLAGLLEEDGRFDVRLSRPERNTVLGTDVVSSLSDRVEGAADFDADYFISIHINSYTEPSINGIEAFAAEGDDEAYELGCFLLQGMLDSTSLKNRGVKSSTELYVLQNTDMPAVLLELGFISNAKDAALLSDSPELFAQGIYNGISAYFEASYTQDVNMLLLLIGASATIVALLSILGTVVRKKACFVPNHKK